MVRLRLYLFSISPLTAGSQNHLTRLRKDKPGYAVNLKKDLAEIIAGVEDSFPRHLSIEEQDGLPLVITTKSNVL